MNKETFMQVALEEAKKTKEKGDLPFGAVVVKDGEIIGQGHACNNTTGDVTDHAELMALREACKNLKTNDLSNCEIYCTNQPCNMCAAEIFQAHIPRVIMSVTRKDLSWFLRPRNIGIEDLANDSSYAISIEKGLMKDKVLEMFEYLKK